MGFQGFQLFLSRGRREIVRILVHADGSVKRRGTRDLAMRDEETYAAVQPVPILEPFLAGLSDGILRYLGKTLTVTHLDLSSQPADEIWVLRLLLLDEQGETQEAAFQWATASRDLPPDVPNLIQLALDLTEPWYQSQRRARLRRRTLENWDEHLHRHPTDSEAFFYRAQLLCNQGQYALALRDLSQSIQLDPNVLETYLLRGQAFFFEGEYERAVADLSMLLPQREDPIAYLVRGNSLAQLGLYERALSDYENVLRLDPRHAPALYHRARTYALLDQPHRAIADYSDCLRLAGDNANASREREECYERVGLKRRSTL